MWILLALFTCVLADCSESCSGELWFGGPDGLFSFNLTTNVTTTYQGTLTPSSDIAFDTNGLLYSTTDFGRLFRVEFINETHFNEVLYLNSSFTFGNSLEFDCDNVAYGTGFTVLYRYFPNGTYYSTSLSPPAFSQGDIALAAMNGLLYATTTLGIVSVNVTDSTVTVIGPSPGFALGLANCNNVLYLGTGSGELYRVDMDPFQVVLLHNLGRTITGMSAQRIAGFTPVAPREDTVSPVVFILPALAAGLLFLLILVALCRPKTCDTTSYIGRFDHTTIDFSGYTLETPSLVIRSGHITEGELVLGLNGGVFTCSSPIFIGDSLGRNIYPGPRLGWLRRGFMPLIVRDKTLHVYFRSGHRQPLADFIR